MGHIIKENNGTELKSINIVLVLKSDRKDKKFIRLQHLERYLIYKVSTDVC
jgi:hypothetical protein